MSQLVGYCQGCGATLTEWFEDWGDEPCLMCGEPLSWREAEDGDDFYGVWPEALD